MGNVLSLLDQPEEEETYAPRYNDTQQYQMKHPPYTTTRYQYSSAPYRGTLTSTEEENTRQSYERSRYERSLRTKIKRKGFELEQEEYERKLKEQEALGRPKIRNKREDREAHDGGYISNDEPYQIGNVEYENWTN